MSVVMQVYGLRGREGGSVTPWVVAAGEYQLN